MIEEDKENESIICHSPSARFKAFSSLAKVDIVNQTGLSPAMTQNKQLFVFVVV